MPDSGIKISISPGASSAGAGRRLAESPSSSFASDKLTSGGQRYTQPGSQRSEIQVDKKLAVDKQLVAEQTALVAEIRELRKAIKATAPQSAERATLQSQIDTRLAQQKSNLAGATNAGMVARDARALTSSSGMALMPSARVLAKSLIGAARDVVMGDPASAIRRVAGAPVPSPGASAVVQQVRQAQQQETQKPWDSASAPRLELARVWPRRRDRIRGIPTPRYCESCPRIPGGVLRRLAL